MLIFYVLLCFIPGLLNFFDRADYLCFRGKNIIFLLCCWRISLFIFRKSSFHTLERNCSSMVVAVLFSSFLHKPESILFFQCGFRNRMKFCHFNSKAKTWRMFCMEVFFMLKIQLWIKQQNENHFIAFLLKLMIG